MIQAWKLTLLMVLRGSSRQDSPRRTTTSWNAFKLPWPTFLTAAHAFAAPWCSALRREAVKRSPRGSAGVNCSTSLLIRAEGLNPCSGCVRQAAVMANSTHPSCRGWAVAGKQHGVWLQDCEDAFSWTDSAELNQRRVERRFTKSMARMAAAAASSTSPSFPARVRRPKAPTAFTSTNVMLEAFSASFAAIST